MKCVHNETFGGCIDKNEQTEAYRVKPENFLQLDALEDEVYTLELKLED